MPAPEVAYLTQDAVLWPKEADGPDGEPRIGSPVELRVRWVATQAEAVGRDGSPIALVALVVVAQDVPDQSIMWQGTLEEWYGTGSAGEGVGLHQVKTLQATPDVKGRSTRRTLGLVRWKDSLPGSA